MLCRMNKWAFSQSETKKDKAPVVNVTMRVEHIRKLRITEWSSQTSLNYKLLHILGRSVIPPMKSCLVVPPSTSHEICWHLPQWKAVLPKHFLGFYQTLQYYSQKSLLHSLQSPKILTTLGVNSWNQFLYCPLLNATRQWLKNVACRVPKFSQHWE